MEAELGATGLEASTAADCSITVANYQLITVIRFISKSYTRP